MLAIVGFPKEDGGNKTKHYDVSTINNALESDIVFPCIHSSWHRRRSWVEKSISIGIEIYGTTQSGAEINLMLRDYELLVRILSKFFNLIKFLQLLLTSEQTLKYKYLMKVQLFDSHLCWLEESLNSQLLRIPKII